MKLFDPRMAIETYPEWRKRKDRELSAIEPIMKFFGYEHLPPDLQAMSKPFCQLAQMIHDSLPRNAERTVSLRKLLEAKDAAVRATLP